jgi:hypothetical protein
MLVLKITAGTAVLSNTNGVVVLEPVVVVVDFEDAVVQLVMDV